MTSRRKIIMAAVAREGRAYIKEGESCIVWYKILILKGRFVWGESISRRGVRDFIIHEGGLRVLLA